jgi:hypothetical protein
MRLLVLLVAASLSVSLAACGDDGPTTVEGPGYRAELPDGWKDAGSGGLTGAAVEGATGTALQSVWVREHRDGDFQANVNVAFEDVPPGSDPLQLARDSLRTLTAGDVPPSLEGALNVTPLTQPTETTLGGDPAATFDYRNDTTSGELHQRAVIAVHRRRAAVVTSTALASAFTDREPEFQSILNSWEWASGD